MIATYDPDTIARLIAEAREDDARMTPAPWHVEVEPHGNGTLVDDVGHRTVTDCDVPIDEEPPGMPPRRANADAIARTRNNLAAVADQLEAALRTNDSLVGDVRHMQDIVTKTRSALGKDIGGAWAHGHAWEIAEQVMTERDALRGEVERLARLQATTVRIATEESGVSSERLANLRQANSTLTAERDTALAELARMRPVVEAAERYRDDGPVGAGICRAVDAYRSTTARGVAP